MGEDDGDKQEVYEKAVIAYRDASEENTQIGLVQFAMKTHAIEIKEEETETETEATDNSLMGKLKNLF